jgi:hypothetical protein
MVTVQVVVVQVVVVTQIIVVVPCHGLGIVRMIDQVKKLIYLITPIEFKRLKIVNLLVRGKTV